MGIPQPARVDRQSALDTNAPLGVAFADPRSRQFPPESVFIAHSCALPELLPMTMVPSNFAACLEEIFAAIENVDGWLTSREVEFLALAAACPTAEGEILEIGSFRGRSAIVLAKASALADSCRISAVDPHPVSGPTIEDEHGNPSAIALFEANLREAGVRDRIEIHQMLSGELATQWDRPLRLLWIDGDHTYTGAKIDYDGFSPYLTDGAMVAFHDVLTPFGCTQVFKEAILEGPHFGPVGFCGSIGWGRFRADATEARPFAAEKEILARRLARLCGYDTPDDCRGLKKLYYHLCRSRIPHARLDPSDWARRAAA